jgi:NAD(P)-dependent dehydrogenase (short-subunit alcohol dehydrogenase family)
MMRGLMRQTPCVRFAIRQRRNERTAIRKAAGEWLADRRDSQRPDLARIFRASEQASFVTGATINVDGGMCPVVRALCHLF